MSRIVPLPPEAPRPAGEAQVRLAAFDPKTEDIFLTYTHNCEHGPGIERTGRGSPAMELWSPTREPGETTTHAIGLRLRTWLIHEGLRHEDLRVVWRELWPWVGARTSPLTKFLAPWVAGLRQRAGNAISPDQVRVEQCALELATAEGSGNSRLVAAKLGDLLALAHDPSLGATDPVRTVLELWQRFNQAELADDLAGMAVALSALMDQAEALGANPEAIKVLRAYVRESPSHIQTAHDQEFHSCYPDHHIIGQQGCGDLTMNLWNVAFLNSPLTLRGEPRLIFLHKEPIDARTYTCLVKWKADSGHVPRVEIREMRFWPNASDVDDMARVHDGRRWVPSGNHIEFAVSNQQVIRDGAVVDLSRLTHQFGDFRHLLKLPNLNPPAAWTFRDSQGQVRSDGGRPRFYFGRLTQDHIWFGEAQFMDDINLQRAAMQGPVFLSRLYQGLGASKEQMCGAMRGATSTPDYTEVDNAHRDLKQGEYRFAAEDDTQVEVFLRPNRYGWTMVGLSPTCDQILCLASEGNPFEDSGYTLTEAAQTLLKAGAHNALLMDEGADVFQRVLPPGATTLQDTIPPRYRTRLRATFIFAHKSAP